MKRIGYCNPFVPAEWMAAHGVEPVWMRLRSAGIRTSAGSNRGVCPYAGAIADGVLAERHASAVVLTTACDQMRYAASLLDEKAQIPVFLMNLPSTWQTPAARRVYREELERLGRFLVRIGGNPPSPDDLAATLLRYDDARAAVREAAPRIEAHALAEALLCVREGAEVPLFSEQGPGPNSGVPLALVGGPMLEADEALFGLLRRAGARVVLDATESGERTLPAPLDAERVASDPLEALTEAYFGTIPDVFRRPNDSLYAWLDRELAARRVRGIVLKRYVWCDLWHAEFDRMKRWSRVPVVEIDIADHDAAAQNRTLGRIEAFLEMLR